MFHAAAYVDRVLPLRGIAVPLAGALEPRLGLFGGRRERTHQTGGQGGRRGRLETAGVERQDHLARPRIEADAVGLGDEPVAFEDEPHFDERLLETRILAP